jgi:hypothetical protein
MIIITRKEYNKKKKNHKQIAAGYSPPTLLQKHLCSAATICI